MRGLLGRSVRVCSLGTRHLGSGPEPWEQARRQTPLAGRGWAVRQERTLTARVSNVTERLCGQGDDVPWLPQNAPLSCGPRQLVIYPEF